MVWTANDWKLYSCDDRGHICSYNLYTNKEDGNIKFQNLIINNIAVSNDSKQIYSVTEDGHIRELYHKTVCVQLFFVVFNAVLAVGIEHNVKIRKIIVIWNQCPKFKTESALRWTTEICVQNSKPFKYSRNLQSVSIKYSDTYVTFSAKVFFL